MTDVVVIEGEDILVVSDISTDVVEVVEETIVVTTEISIDVITEAEQGPPGPPGDTGPMGPQGPQGDPGPAGDANGAFLVSNRLSEIAADPAAQAQAQQNIGLGAVDPLAYYILAKA